VSYSLRIGGICLAVDGAPAPRGPLAKFVVADCAPDVKVRLRRDGARPAGELAGPPLFDSGAVWKRFDDRIECYSQLFGEQPYKTAILSPDLSEVEIVMRVEGLEPLEFPLDELLINALLTERFGVELHACGVIDRGNGLLFLGNSGDGKTTTARLWMSAGAPALGRAPGAGAPTLVSDDRVIVRAENGEWTMYGTPWHGEAEICSPASAPLRRIYVLDKAARNSAAPLCGAEAVARLFACAFPPFHAARGIDGLLGTLSDLVADVPVARLSFVNDASAVAFVREEAAA